MNYLQQLREVKAAISPPAPGDEPPWVRKHRDQKLKDAMVEGDWWRRRIAQISGTIDRHGVARLPMRDVYLQLGVPPERTLSVSHHVCALMRAAGWSRRRIGRGLRLWVWERQEL